MDPVQFELLRLEDFAYQEARRFSSCARRYHVRMTFFRFHKWHCRFYTGRWQLLPKRLTFRKAASIRENAGRGDGLIDNDVRKALDRCLKIGRGDIMLRLSDEQFQAIGGVLPATPDATDNTGAGKEDISSKTGFSSHRS